MTGPARGHLGRLTAAHQRAGGETNEAKLDKTGAKYTRAPVVLAVAAHTDVDAGAVMRAENRDAVAAGVQNLLLGATALGLASYWGTGAATAAAGIHELCGFEPSDVIVALIYLGWPAGDVANPGRRPPTILFVD